MSRSSGPDRAGSGYNHTAHDRHPVACCRHPAPRRRVCVRRGRGRAAARGRRRTGRTGCPPRAPGRRAAAGAPARLGGVRRAAHRGGARGVRAPSAHRVPGRAGRRAGSARRRRAGPGPLAARARSAPRCWPRSANWSCTRRTSTRARCACTPGATCPPRRSTRVTCSRRCRTGCAAGWTRWSPTRRTYRPRRSPRCRRRRRDHEARRSTGRRRGRPGRAAPGGGASARLAGAWRPPTGRDQHRAGAGDRVGLPGARNGRRGGRIRGTRCHRGDRYVVIGRITDPAHRAARRRSTGSSPSDR